jgi:hypothetical protein
VEESFRNCSVGQFQEWLLQDYSFPACWKLVAALQDWSQFR